MIDKTTNVSGTGCRVIMVRHAHTEMAGRFCGITDPPLSLQGIAQLAGLNRKLRAFPITHIFSSQLQRARQTAASVAANRGLRVEYLEVLHELAFGSWEGLDWDQIMARDPEYAQRWLDRYPSVPAPGGEYFDDFFQRVQYAMNAIGAKAEGGCAVVVTHGGVIRTFLHSVAQLQRVTCDFSQCDYVSCWEVSWNDGEWRLPIASAKIGDTSGEAARATEYQDVTL